MKKTTKGAAAAGAAAVLLLGGAGSLAYWTATGTANAGSIIAGKLTLTNGACDTNWVYAGTTTVPTKIVPGDAITKNCKFTIGAQGDHLSATPTVPPTIGYSVTSTPAPTTLSLPVTATYDINGTALTATSKITQANDTQTLNALIKVTFPYGSTTVNYNDTQNLAATINTLTVSLMQDTGSTNPNP